MVVKSGAQALKNANSVGFDVKASLELQGSLKGMSSSQGALLNGPLTDRYGRKRPLYIGVSLYVLVSIGCALAPNLQALIGLRFVQGFTGCVGMVVARAVLNPAVTSVSRMKTR